MPTLLTNPLVKSLVSTSLAKYLTGGAFLGRNFIDLDSTASAHYLLAKPWQPAADYSYEASLYFTGSILRPMGDTGNFNSRIFINTDGSIEWRPSTSSGSLTAPAASLPVNLLSKLKVVRIGSTGTIYVNGVSVATGTVPTGALNLEGFGFNSTSYSDGIISQVGLTDLTTPANSEYYRLNSLTKEYELPSNNVFGSELWVNPPDVIASGWVDNGSSTYTHTGAISEIRVTTGGPLESSTAYLVKLSVSGAGSVGVQLGGATVDGNNISPSLAAGIDHEVVLKTNSAITFNGIRISSSTETTVSNITVREVTNYITYENIALGKPTRDTYTLVDGDWLGSELVVNGNFGYDGDWNKSADWTIGSGVASLDTTTNFSSIRQDALASGAIYSTEFTVLNYVAGNVRYKLGSSNFGTVRVANGTYSEIINSDGASAGFINTLATSELDIDNVSVKRLIEVAP